MKLIIGNSYTYLEGASSSEVNAVWDALSFQVPNYHIIKRKKNIPHWNGMSSMLDKRNRRFLTGLLPDVCKHLVDFHVGYEVEDRRKKPKASFEEIELDGIELYDYQMAAVETFVQHGRGVLDIAPSGGKTEIAIATSQHLNLKTLFLVNRVGLMEQSAKRFAKRWPDCSNSIGLLGGGEYDPRQITFATVQTINSALKSAPDEIAEFLRSIEFIIIDEAHNASSATFCKAINLCENAYYRMCLSGTPFMKANPEANMTLQGIAGNRLVKISNDFLIRDGATAKPYFKFIPTKCEKLKSDMEWMDVYEQGVVHNEHRNRLISLVTQKLIDQGKRPLVLVERIKHGENLMRELQSIGIRCDFVYGQDDQYRRNQIIRQFQKGQLDVLLANTIFDEGISVDEITALVNAGAGKSSIKIFQRIGRVMRLNEDDDEAFIVDFFDSHHPMLINQSKGRYEVVSQEDGFILV